MDFIIGIFILAIWIFGIGAFLRAISSGTKAAVKTLTKGGNIVDNIKEEYRDIGQFEINVSPTQVEIGEKIVDAFDVKVRGLIEAPYTSDLALVTSVFDSTSGDLRAVISSLDFFQEKATEGFQNVVEAGQIRPNEGYRNWVKVATLYPETLTGTHKGKRKLTICVRAMPSDQIPLIEWGMGEKGMITFSAATHEVEIELNEKGWIEAQEERSLAKQLMVKIAVSVASADGEMNAAEGKIIQSWIKDQLRGLSESNSQKVKSELNAALKEAFIEAQNGELNQEKLVLKLKDLELHSINQTLLEFLVTVIGADNEITQDEMAIIKKIGLELSVDYDDIKAMSDKAFLEMGSVPETANELEALLGIDASWDGPKVLAHLRGEFSKWNGRIQALEDEEEKDKAQKMLDAIAVARQKYGAK
jgi:tellurite resistance protein